MDRFAIITSGGKQYRVKQGDVVRVERIAGKSEGDTVELPVLATHENGALVTGTPNLDTGASGTIVQAGRGDKVIVFKKHRRQTYRRTNGHRQSFHDVRIDAIPTV